MRGKSKYLVRWKRYIVERNTQKELEDLENVIKLVKEFKKQIREKEIRKVQIRKQKPLHSEIERFKRSKLLENYTVKILFEQDDEKFEEKYLKKLERN